MNEEYNRLRSMMGSTATVSTYIHDNLVEMREGFDRCAIIGGKGLCYDSINEILRLLEEFMKNADSFMQFCRDKQK
jgi:hypothetical protein